jgi:hypothetical protein
MAAIVRNYQCLLGNVKLVYATKITMLNYCEIKKNFLALVREQTIPTERLPLVGEVSANFCG